MVSCVAKGQAYLHAQQACKYQNVSCVTEGRRFNYLKVSCLSEGQISKYLKNILLSVFQKSRYLVQIFQISSVADGREYGGCCQRGNPAVWTRRVMSSKVLLRRKMLQSRFDLLISFQGICRGPDLTFISYLPKKCCGADLILTSYSKMLGLNWC